MVFDLSSEALLARVETPASVAEESGAESMEETAVVNASPTGSQSVLQLID